MTLVCAETTHVMSSHDSRIAASHAGVPRQQGGVHRRWRRRARNLGAGDEIASHCRGARGHHGKAAGVCSGVKPCVASRRCAACRRLEREYRRRRDASLLLLFFPNDGRRLDEVGQFETNVTDLILDFGEGE